MFARRLGYNDLPHANDLDNVEHLLPRLGRAFVDEGVAQIFVATRLHRHFFLPAKTRLVHRHPTPDIDICRVELDDSDPQIRPCSYFFKDGQAIPYEYSDDTKYAAVKEDIVTKIGLKVCAMGLENIFGIALRSRDGEWLENLLPHDEGTVARRSITSVSTVVATEWAFEVKSDGDVAYFITRKCHTPEGGGHIITQD